MAVSRSSLTRERILVAAATAFAGGGYDSVNVNDVVSSLGMTKGALYHSFPSKEGLARAVLDRFFATWTALMDRVCTEEDNELDAIVAMTYEVARAIHEDPILRAGIRLSIDPALFQGDQQPYLLRIDRFAGVLRSGQQRGIIRREVDPSAVAWLLVALLTGAQALPASIADNAELIERLDTLWALIRPSLAA